MVGVLWEDLTWPDAERLAGEVGMVIIPVGATEQHGPHLPVGVDSLLVTHVAHEVSGATGVPVLPTVVYGHSWFHQEFPGTVSLSPEGLSLTLQDLVRSVYRAGFRRFLVLNGHVGNLGALLCARDRLRMELQQVRLRIVTWWDMAEGGEFTSDLPVDPKQFHANYGETSCMLALRPDLVHPELAVDQAEKDLVWDYRVHEKSASGVLGRNATGAGADAGRRILAQAIERIEGLVRRGLREEPPLGDGK